MGERTVVRLGDVCDIVSGTTPSSTKPEYWDGGLPWVTPAEISDDSHIITDTQRTLTEAGVLSKKLPLLPKGTVLLSSRAPIGKVAIAGCDMYCNQGFKNLICSDAIFNEYLYCFLKSQNERLQHMGHGATFKELSKKTLADMMIPVPSLDMQHEIVSTLEAVSKLTAIAKQMLAKADELIQSRFVEMFERDKQIKHVRLDHISLVGSSHRVFKSEILTSGVPFYRGSEISSLSRGDSTSASLFISYEHYEELISQSGKPEIGDLLLPSICDKGQIWCVNTNDPFYFKDGRVLWIRPDKTIINSEYLKRAICSVLYKDFIKLTSGTTFAELKIFILKGIEVPLPPLALQNEFAEFVAQVESLKTTTRQQLDRLNTLYDSLAQRYFAE